MFRKQKMKLPSAFLAGGCCLLILGAPLSAQDIDPRVAQVVADWQKRQERIVRVRYLATGQMTIPKGSISSQLDTYYRDRGEERKVNLSPAEDVACSIRQLIAIDFAGGRYRVETEKQTFDRETNERYPFQQIRVFDGNEIRSWRPPQFNTHPSTGVKRGAPELGVGQGDLSGATFGLLELPFFAGHGSIAWEFGPISARKLRTYPDPEMLVVHGQAAYGGRSCLVLRTQTYRASTTSFDEYWVDPGRESALVRQIHYLGKTAQYEISIVNQSTEQGWLPKSWTYTQRQMGNGATTAICKMTVEQLELAPALPLSDFRIEERPGMIVDVAKYPSKTGAGQSTEIERAIYRIGDDGKRHLISTSVPRTSHRWWYYTAGVLAAVIVLLAIWRIRRIRRLRTA
jgi:hypothetical protein